MWNEMSYVEPRKLSAIRGALEEEIVQHKKYAQMAQEAKERKKRKSMKPCLPGNSRKPESSSAPSSPTASTGGLPEDRFGLEMVPRADRKE